MIYLDSAATTPVSKETYECMRRYLCEEFFNPSAIYTPALNVSKDIDRARKSIADYLHCDVDEIYFTSGSSESNSWAFQGWLKKHKDGVIITTPIEHHSIISMTEDKDIAPHIKMIAVDEIGAVDITSLKNAIDDLTYLNVCKEDILVAIQFANNEIGTIQNMRLISDICASYGVTLFTDATQIFSCMSMKNALYNYKIDMMSMSGHKIGCPKGIGILYKSKAVEISPIIYGTQNFGLRGGTENVPSIVVLGKAFNQMDIFDDERTADFKNLKNTSKKLFDRLNAITPIRLNGSNVLRLPNNLNITFEKKIVGHALEAVLSALGVYVSHGSACNSANSESSHVLKAIGVSDEDVMKTIRISLPKDFDDKDVDAVVKYFEIAIELLLHE